MFKVFYDKKQENIQQPQNPLWSQMTINDIKGLDDLMGLWEGGHTDETGPIPLEESGS